MNMYGYVHVYTCSNQYMYVQLCTLCIIYRCSVYNTQMLRKREKQINTKQHNTRPETTFPKKSCTQVGLEPTPHAF